MKNGLCFASGAKFGAELVDGSRFRFMITAMKALLSVVLAAVVGQTAFGDGLTQVEINGKTYTNITKAYVGTGGLVIILFPGGGTSATVDKVPTNFLSSWNINQASQAAAKATQATIAENNLDRAIEGGCFREVKGVVYDTRKSQADWATFYNVKVVQVLDEGVIIDTTPNSLDDHVAIFVKHLPTVSDTDYITFTALPSGTYSYINKLADDRTIRAYDVGRVCDRSEIPQTVLAGKRAYDVLAVRGAPQTDALASLPDSDNLKVSGSGFFVSEDGYLITNAHVVRNARRVNVKNGAGVFPAEIVLVDDTNDLALLKVSGHFAALCISTNDVQLGDPVFTIGFPAIDLQGMEPKYTDGKISSLSGLMDDPTEYQISVQVQPGNSGGPLVDTTGRVKGVIVSRLNDLAALRSMGSLPQNVNYAIKGTLLRNFLSQSPEVKLVSGNSLADSKSAVSAVRQAVAIVLVY